jgi:hypothetical protein
MRGGIVDRSALLVASLLAACTAGGAPHVRDGDIIFHTSRSSQSVAIQKATASPYSHMGIVFYRGGAPYVFEAVATVRYTPLARWTDRGSGGHFVVKRLKDAKSLLTPQVLEAMRQAARQMEGRRYDPAFGWSDERMYCSELVWKLYERSLGVRVGELQVLKDFNLPAPEVRAKLRERYGDQVPLEEPVIAPGAMFSSSALETVAQR